jgi:hypothetical protein
MKPPEYFGQHKGVDGQIQLVNYRNAARFERLIEQRKYPYKQSSPMALQVHRKRARKASVLEQGNWAIVPRLYAHRSNAQVDALYIPVQEFHLLRVRSVVTSDGVVIYLVLLNQDV